MDRKEWLQNLKVGDEVYVSRKMGTPERETVSRLTRTKIVISRANSVGLLYDIKFRKDSGWEVNSDIWNKAHLIEPSDKVREQAELARLKERANYLRARLPTPQTKEKLIAFIEALSPFVEGQK